MLSSQQYTLGKGIQEFLNDFNMQYKSVKESAGLIPQPMEGVMQMVQETVKMMQS